jgi:hypothetical protein
VVYKTGGRLMQNKSNAESFQNLSSALIDHLSLIIAMILYWMATSLTPLSVAYINPYHAAKMVVCSKSHLLNFLTLSDSIYFNL